MSKTQSKLGITIPSASLNCCCWTNIIYYYDEGVTENGFKLLVEGCDGSDSLEWQYSNNAGVTWSTISFANPGFLIDPASYFPYAPGANGAGMYRIKITKIGCCDTYSNIIEAYLL